MKFSEIELPSNRKLGFFFSAIFFLVGTYLIINGVSRLAHILIVMSVVFLMIAFVTNFHKSKARS